MDDDHQFRVAEQTFAQNFRPDCADLIYGLAQGSAGNQRELYVQSLDPVKEAAARIAYYTCDQYNNNLGLFSPSNTFAEMDSRVRAGGKGEKNEPITAEQRRFYAGIRNSRFNPSQLFGTQNRELGHRLAKEGYAGVDRDQLMNPDMDLTPFAVQYKMVRMACKHGLQHFAETYARKHRSVVHFILDGVDVDAVLAKVKKSGHLGKESLPITYSELRMCYRNWDLYSQCVWFYRNLRICPAPWVENAAGWSGYGEQRREKWESLRAHVSDAIEKYDKQSGLFTKTSKETKDVISICRLLLKNNADLTTLKHYIRWFLGFIDVSPPATNYVVTVQQLSLTSRFWKTLEEEYMRWCQRY
jgi:hypothetical protein